MIKTLATCIVSCVAFTVSSHAAITVIDFESDAPGPVPNGFQSVQSPLVTFTDSDGSDLSIGNFGIASIGQGLAVGRDDNSLLVMDFSTLIDSLSLDFGNDDPALSEPGDEVILTAYLDGRLVDSTFVEMNRNTAMDQTITFSGAVFNSATIEYYVSSTGLTKVVDNIVFNTVPGPGTGILGALAIVGLVGRRRR